MATALRSARRHYLVSALIAQRAAGDAVAARSRGNRAMAHVVKTAQIHQAQQSASAVSEMLAEQDIAVRPDATLLPAAFASDPDSFAAMADQTANDLELARLVQTLVQSAGRAAEGAGVALRPHVMYVRYLSPPSCSRCSVLAGRVYRYSTGFLRHPRCDCTMQPTSAKNARALVPDIFALARQGLVNGLSKADMLAVRDGADLTQIVNVRRKAAGLSNPGTVLARNGRPTPEAIYRMAADREEAVALLERYGYAAGSARLAA